MAEQLLEKPICQACSADVRPGALFCYNCGSAVAEVENDRTNNNGAGNFQLREQIIQKEDNTYSPKHTGIDEKPIEKPLNDPFALPVGKTIEVEDKNLASDGESGLKTAASLRKKNRTAEKKKIEVVWEPPQNSSNILFVLVSLFLLLVAVGILMAMLYIR